MVANRFQVGQVVVSLVSAQGLREGEEYVVEQVLERSLFFGNIVTYVLVQVGERPEENPVRWAVANGHLVLANTPS